MLNPIEAYIEAGRRSAVAVNQGDWMRSKHESDFARRMWNLEHKEDAKTAKAAFDEAYRAARNTLGAGR